MHSKKITPAISLIAAIDENYAIGYKNHLLCHLPADLKYFKDKTLNKPVIMGHKTFDSIGKALPKRLNIVLSRQNLQIADAIVAHSLNEAIGVCENYPEVMIIGGEGVFSEALPLAQKIYLTLIHHKFATADTYFPVLDKKDWVIKEIGTTEKDDKNLFDLTFYEYIRSNR